jgi:hypothetical protein
MPSASNRNRVIIAIIVGVVAVIFIGVTVYGHLNNQGAKDLAVYDKCLNEPYPDGPDCQTIFHDCANGDSYACHLERVLGCVAETGAGCDNTGSSP